MEQIWHNIINELTYHPSEPLIFSTGLFLVLFVAFSFVYMLLGQAHNSTSGVCHSLFLLFLLQEQRLLFPPSGLRNGQRLPHSQSDKQVLAA